MELWWIDLLSKNGEFILLFGSMLTFTFKPVNLSGMLASDFPQNQEFAMAEWFVWR